MHNTNNTWQYQLLRPRWHWWQEQTKMYAGKSQYSGALLIYYIKYYFYYPLALITRPPDGVLLAAALLAARRLRRLAWSPRTLLELCNSTSFRNRSLGVAAARHPDVVCAPFARWRFLGVSYFCHSCTHTLMTLTLTLPETLPGWTWVRVSSFVSIGPAVWPAIWS